MHLTFFPDEPLILSNQDLKQLFFIIFFLFYFLITTRGMHYFQHVRYDIEGYGIKPLWVGRSGILLR